MAVVLEAQAMTHSRWYLTAVVGICLCWPSPTLVAADDGEQKPAAVADSAGQADLDAAIDAKLAAKQLDDFATVLDLCRRALKKGLEPESKKFAEELYTGTLIDRAGMVVEAIFGADRPDDQWPRMRAFAMRDLNEVVERDPKMGQAHLMIARLEALPNGNEERAGAAAKKALDLLGDDRLQMAQAHLVLGTVEPDAQKRIAAFDKAVELAPRDSDIRRTRALALLVEEEFKKAREDLEVAIEEKPDDPSLHEALGMACMMGEQFDDAIKALDKAVQLAPDAPGPLLQRARIRAVKKDYDAAITDIDKAIDIDPDDPATFILRARIHQQAGDSDRALADVERVLDQSPDYPPALELRGLLAAERNEYEAAIRDFRRLVAKKSDDPVLLSQLAMLYLAAKQPREAIRRFTRALEIDDEHFASRRGRSDAEISIGDHKAAIGDLEKALELEPDDTGVLNNLAWLLATSPEDALRDGKRAVELARKACEKTEWKEPHIISTLAAGHAEAGDFEAARKFSKQAVETGDPAPEIKRQLESELASYAAGKAWRERQEMEEATGGAASPAAGGAAANKPAETKPAAPKPTDGDAKEKRPPRRPFDED
jgi:tetratricopeptide (TPR) repeat protein